MTQLHAEFLHKYHDYATGEHVPVLIAIKDGRKTVARVWPQAEDYNKHDLDKAFKLAHLFAAAPDLLEACEEALEIVDQVHHAGAGYVSRMIDAAIAKAKGE